MPIDVKSSGHRFERLSGTTEEEHLLPFSPTAHGGPFVIKYVSYSTPHVFLGAPASTLSKDQQKTCQHALSALAKDAGSPNWDGVGAAAVSSQALAVAREIVGMLPKNAGPPDISADPHGHVEFDWYLDNGTMFTISVGAEGDLAISGLRDGQAKLRGMEWDAATPRPLLLLRCGLEWLKNLSHR